MSAHSGSLMQLVSYGSENLYLNGNADLSFFKTVYQKHTNYASESINEFFDPQTQFSTTSNNIMNLNIRRHGDLLREITIVIDIPDIYSTAEENFRWIKNLGFFFINSVELVIGSQIISRLYGQWMMVWSELTTELSQRQALDEMTGNIPEVYAPTYYYGASYPTIRRRRLRIQLPFYFTKKSGLSLPLIGIQFVEIYLRVEFNKLNSLFTVGSPPVSPQQYFNGAPQIPSLAGLDSSNLFWHFMTNQQPSNWSQNTYVELLYVYLDNNERRVFAMATSEYLITQVDRAVYMGVQGNTAVEPTFYHPVIEMIWVYQRDDAINTNQWSNFTALKYDDEYKEFLEVVKSYQQWDEAKVPYTTALGAYTLKTSGRPVADFINSLNCTDASSSPDIDSFDNYFNIMYHCELFINGHSRQIAKDYMYYTAQEPYNTHTSSGKQINVMSFSLHPEQFQPSGTANFSLFKEVQLQMTLKKRQLPSCDIDNQEAFNMYLYVRNYNVLRIIGGMAGLAFAN